MNSENLLDLVGEAREEYVQMAGQHKTPQKEQKKVKGSWRKWASVAACVVCLMGGVWVALNMGGASGGGGTEGMIYHFYAGPVLPLTMMEEREGLSAKREILFDFSPYIPQEYSYEGVDGEVKTYNRIDSEVIVTDRYVLTNDSEEDMTITALYPFAGTLRGTEYYPSLTVNGTAVETVLHAGAYVGGFRCEPGEAGEPGTVNLDNEASFEVYEDLLADDSYLRTALTDPLSLDIPVIVYRLSDYVYSQDKTAENPTIGMSFTIDFDETVVFTYGMNGAVNDSQSGFCIRSKGAVEYDPDPENGYNPPKPQDSFVILWGEDIQDYEIQGYRTGACEAGNELEDLTCTVTRYETTLGELLHEVILRDWSDVEGLDVELLYDMTVELLATTGPFEGDDLNRYRFSSLGTVINTAYTNMRVMYLSCELTIPSGGSVVVQADMRRDESHDFYGDSVARDGYDMATQLGSCLSFTEQTAALKNTEWIQILGQNFGFDLENGITQVVLDPAQSRYWMDIQYKK